MSHSRVLFFFFFLSVALISALFYMYICNCYIARGGLFFPMVARRTRNFAESTILKKKERSFKKKKKSL